MDPAWRRFVPRVDVFASRCARVAGMADHGGVSVVLADDRLVRGLNTRHRGQNKPTNVLTYEYPAPEVVLALGVVRREAAAAGRRCGAPPGASGRARRAASAWPRSRSPGRCPPHGNGGSPRVAPAWRAESLETSVWTAVMTGGRATFVHRLRNLIGRKAPEPTLRESIAELMQEAADAPETAAPASELNRHERLLIANILRLRETTADDVMIPRADIVAMRADLTLEQTIEQIRSERHSRLPVYREQLDDIVGMVHVKDVFAYVGRPEEFSLEAILRKPLMVAPRIRVLDLMLQMRQQRMHMALVVDEYGGIDGLVTIEDLVETITGEIDDEHDDEETPMVTERPDGALDLNARLAGGGVRGTHGADFERGRAGRGYRYGWRIGVHVGREGAGEGRGYFASVGIGIQDIGRGCTEDQAADGHGGRYRRRRRGLETVRDSWTNRTGNDAIAMIMWNRARHSAPRCQSSRQLRDKASTSWAAAQFGWRSNSGV